MNNHKCRRCGECCRCSPTLTEKDVERIKKSGLKEEDFLQVVHKTVCMQTINNECKFLQTNENGETFCKIYNFRPEICRIYPGGNYDNCQPAKLKFDEYLEERRKK